MWFNPIMSWMIRSPLHFMVSKNMMLMTYTGRKSGKAYTTPLNYLAMDDAFYTTSYRDRVWWPNLRGGADVTLHLRGEEVPAKAETIEDQTDTGLSIDVDPYGRILAQTDFFGATDQKMVAQVPVRHVPTVYTAFGRWFEWLCLAGFLFVVAWTVIARRQVK